jgi:hypothetical protein
MSAPHYLVFIGATPSLSTELLKLRASYPSVCVIAIAAPKHAKGTNDRSVQTAITNLKKILAEDGRLNDEARLSVWAYEFTSIDEFKSVWKAFGCAAWVESVPARLRNQDRLTRMHIQGRIPLITPLIHAVASEVYGHRSTSPLPLPFQNFKSKLIKELTEHWYAGLSFQALKSALSKIHQRFREAHTKNDRRHHDDRSLQFSPAIDYHGQSHPVGSCDRCFISGRFRFGAALFPGFHYDLYPSFGKLNCVLVDCEGDARNLGPEKRDYINIYPNDHLLPEK